MGRRGWLASVGTGRPSHGLGTAAPASLCLDSAGPLTPLPVPSTTPIFKGANQSPNEPCEQPQSFYRPGGD
jgi:hypothetical protein